LESVFTMGRNTHDQEKLITDSTLGPRGWGLSDQVDDADPIQTGRVVPSLATRDHFDDGRNIVTGRLLDRPRYDALVERMVTLRFSGAKRRLRDPSSPRVRPTIAAVVRIMSAPSIGCV